MKKVFSMKNLKCANCARKIEDAVSRFEGVESVQVNFLTHKMTLVADDAHFDAAHEAAKRAAARIEPGCVLG